MVTTAELVLQVLQLGAHVDAQTGVEIGERLVHQEGLRMAYDRAGEGDALALASGKLAGQIRQQLREAEARGDVASTSADDFGRRTLANAQRKSDILRDGHVRIKRVALKHHGDVAVAGFQARDIAAAEQ